MRCTMYLPLAAILLMCVVSGAEATNLSITDVYVCNDEGEPATPHVGERFWVCVYFTYFNPECRPYVIRRTVNEQTIDAPEINWGCGYSGYTSWVHVWGTWQIDVPGVVTGQVTLDALDAIEESNEGDNSAAFEVEILPAPEVSLPRLTQPVAGRMGVDIAACTLFDHGDVGNPISHFCEPWAYQGHAGNDYGNGGFEAMDLAPVPIYAVLPGVVVEVVDGYNDRRTDCNHGDPGRGNSIKIEHGNGLSSVYAHLQIHSPLVTVGEEVVAGQQIATMGSSGCSSGPHLHFEMRHNGLPFDPLIGACNPVARVSFAQQPPITPRATVDTYVSTQCDGAEPPAHYYFRPWETLVTINAPIRHLAPGTVVEWAWYQNGAEFAAVSLDPFVDYGCGGNWRWCFFRPADEGPGFVQTIVDGEVVWRQPFLAVSTDFVIPENAPPTTPVAAFRTTPQAGRPTWVELTQASADPDYDPVYYEYAWYVDDQLVRSCETVALSDALPADLNASGQTLRCRVTPKDGSGTGAFGEVIAVFAPLGDIDGDGVLGVEDLVALGDCVAGPGVVTPPAGCDPADFVASDLDWDGDSDLLDYAAFQADTGGG